MPICNEQHKNFYTTEHRLSKYFAMKKKKFAVAKLKYGQGMKIN